MKSLNFSLPKLISIALIIVLFSCKSSQTSTSSKAEKGKTIEKGVASWYGPGFHGKKTASGETFNTNGYTAAHRTLPFGTKLKVINLNNGKSVVVRVNDRGPYAKNRIIDLSKAAASKIDMIKSGTASVELILLSQDPSDIKVDDLKQPTYAIQIASFGDIKNANAKAKQFKDGWVKKTVSKGKSLYRVYVGKFIKTEDAKRRLNQLKSKGMHGFVKQIEN